LSLFSRKVEIALREKELSYQRELVPFTQQAGYQPKHPVVARSNPKGQVPVLLDGDLILYDSTVILEYLEDAYPEPSLYPREPRARARCRLTELEADEVLFAPVRHLLYRTEPASDDPSVQARRETAGRAAEADLLRQFAGLDARLRDATWFGGSFSAADIAMFMVILWTQRLNGPRLSATPALGAWYARMLARPACAQAAEEIACADRELSPALRGGG
jgi:glutathione S-transferase